MRPAQGDGGTRDDIKLMCRAAGLRLGHQIKANIARNGCLHLGIGNADQNNRFRMFDQRRADNMRIGINGHQGVDRLARITRGRHKIRGVEHPSDGFTRLQHRGDVRVGLRGAIGICTRDQLPRRDLGQKLGQQGLGHGGNRGGECTDKGKYADQHLQRASLIGCPAA